MTFKLFKIFLSNLFSFSDFVEGFKKGPKGIFKNIFIILCCLYLFVVFGVMYVLFSMNTYNSLAYMGAESLFPGIALALSLLVIFNFGIISVGSSYYAGKGEEQFLSMPIASKEFFGAKFGVSFITDALIGIVLFAISAGYFGYKQGLLVNPLFYLGLLITAIVASVVVIAVIYFLLIIVLYFVPSLRKRSFLIGLSSFFVIAMAMFIGGFSGFTGSIAAVDSVESAEDVISSLSSPLMDAVKDIKIFNFLGDALKGKIIPILVLIGICAVVIFVFIPLLSKLYIKTFEGASDIKTKKISKEKIEKVVSTETKRNSIFKAMYFRDVKGVFREPTFFANGPLGTFLFPLILIVCFFVPLIANNKLSVLVELGSSINNIFETYSPEKIGQIKYFICFGLITFTLFCANLNTVASTSFSREGKGFYSIKAMPVKNEIIIKVKFLHALSYILISCLITILLFISAILFLGIKFPVMEVLKMILIMIFVVCTVSSLLIIIDMLFDTMNPKLNWENPAAAMKQNMNTLFGMLVSLATVLIFAGLGVVWGLFIKANLSGLIFIGAIFGIIAAPVGSAYFKYAEKKITIM